MRVTLSGLLILVVWCAAGLVGCGQNGDAKGAARSEAVVRPVHVARPERRPMTHAIQVTGTLAAQEKSVLSAKAPGRLQTITVDLGSVVKAGDLLAQIEPRDYELRWQQAAAELAQART